MLWPVFIITLVIILLLFVYLYGYNEGIKDGRRLEKEMEKIVYYSDRERSEQSSQRLSESKETPRDRQKNQSDSSE